MHKNTNNQIVLTIDEWKRIKGVISGIVDTHAFWDFHHCHVKQELRNKIDDAWMLLEELRSKE